MEAGGKEAVVINPESLEKAIKGVTGTYSTPKKEQLLYIPNF